jgi:hypothetical protein
VKAGGKLVLFFDPEDGGDMFLPKRLVTFNGLLGAISLHKHGCEILKSYNSF